MFPLQRGRMLVEMAKRKTSTPNRQIKKRKLDPENPDFVDSSDLNLQDISLTSSMLETDPDFSFDFGSDVDIGLSSILSKAQDASVNPQTKDLIHDPNSLKENVPKIPYLTSTPRYSDIGSLVDQHSSFEQQHQDTFSIRETMAIILNEEIDTIVLAPSTPPTTSNIENEPSTSLICQSDIATFTPLVCASENGQPTSASNNTFENEPLNLSLACDTLYRPSTPAMSNIENEPSTSLMCQSDIATFTPIVCASENGQPTSASNNTFENEPLNLSLACDTLYRPSTPAMSNIENEPSTSLMCQSDIATFTPIVCASENGQPTSASNNTFENEPLNLSLACDTHYRPSTPAMSNIENEPSTSSPETGPSSSTLASSPALTDSNAHVLQRDVSTGSDDTAEITPDQRIKLIFNHKESKENRLKGEAYVGRKCNSDTGGYALVEKAAKEMGQRCNCKGRGTNCHTIPDDQRKQSHHYFWKSLQTWNERQVYISALVDTHPTNHGEGKRRKLTYHLKLDGSRKTVCQTMFLNTFNLSNWTVRDWCSTDVTEKPSKRSAYYDRNLTKKDHCMRFLNSLNTMPSHYCRKDTDKNYLERCFRSYEDLYSQYKTQCEEEDTVPLDMKTFKQLFKSHPKKLALFFPRKDQCDVCVEHDVGNMDEAAWKKHQAKFSRARDEKTNDKKHLDEGTLLLTMDLQAVLLAPSIQASALYYRTKLTVHNFTLFDLGTADVDCYVWHEVEGGLTANEFSSCLHSHLTKKLAEKDYQKCIIYSDGCTYQNRNKTMAKTLSLVARRHNVSIVQKFLEKGHTQMECDSVHATIEKNLKKNKRPLDIHSPSDYMKVIKESRKGNTPYKVHYLTHDFFKSFDDVTPLSSLRPGKTVGDPTVVDIRAIRYNPNGDIEYKLDHADTWSILPRARNDAKVTTSSTPKPLYHEPRKISKEKYNHLQQMKPVLPKDVHSFYDNLPH